MNGAEYNREQCVLDGAKLLQYRLSVSNLCWLTGPPIGPKLPLPALSSQLNLHLTTCPCALPSPQPSPLTTLLSLFYHQEPQRLHR